MQYSLARSWLFLFTLQDLIFHINFRIMPRLYAIRTLTKFNNPDLILKTRATCTSTTRNRIHKLEVSLMGLMDFFKKEDKDAFDPLRDLELSKLRVGFYLDFDLKTWEVKSLNTYDFGEGYATDEWELVSGREKWFLERSEDDEVEWSFSKKIPIGAIEGQVRQHIIDHEDPPEQIVCKGKTYYLDESGSGRMYENGKGTPKEFIYWDFIDDDDEHFVTIEQWGETEFEASEGYYVEEYQFSNILPGEITS